MAIIEHVFDGPKLALPYGPTRGMLQAIELLRRTTPSRIDSDFLRASGVAPGNEYKVVGALRFLSLIDDKGSPTEKSRLLKTRGATYTQALQEIVHAAYHEVFRHLGEEDVTRDEVYNYFVTEGGLGAEMATKATRFFIRLCRLAGIELAANGAHTPTGRKKRTGAEQRARRLQAIPASLVEAPAPNPPIVLALTPEMADMDLDHLTEFFRKMRIAWERSQPTKG